MKIIFLDIDGVLCTPLSFRLSRFLRLPMERQRFDPIALSWLRWLVQKTQAEVVLSSSWRDALMTADPLCRAIFRNLFAQLDANRTPISDVTPFLADSDKGAEIAAWLACTPCQHYVILDDNNCFSSRPAIQAHWVPIPESRGLRRREALAALQLLRSGS